MPSPSHPPPPLVEEGLPGCHEKGCREDPRCLLSWAEIFHRLGLMFDLSSWGCSSEVIAPLRKVETSLGEVRPPLISFIALVILPEEVTKKAVEASDKRLTEASGKHPTDTLSGQQKKAKVTGRHKSHREGEGSKSRAAKCKKSASPVDKTLTPKARPKSVREL
ncbi:hypothetical protein BHM03_00012158 [Ensete ventricosum]|nr:hypothetical protein BHM03_00012158 [Ensete ventricosum]